MDVAGVNVCAQDERGFGELDKWLTVEIHSGLCFAYVCLSFNFMLCDFRFQEQLA